MSLSSKHCSIPVTATMAEQSVTEDSIRTALADRLQVVHVEVQDMSGMNFPCASPDVMAPAPEPRDVFWQRVCHLGLTQNLIWTGGCGQAFTTLIVSPVFAGKNSLKRHRLVNAALKDEIAQIHAWTARCQTPEEWEKEKAASGGADGPSFEGTSDGKVTGVDQ